MFVCFIFRVRVSLYNNSGCSGAHAADQAGLELTEIRICFLNAAPPLPGFITFFLKTGSHVAWAALPSIGIKGQMIKSTVGKLTEILKRKYRKGACRDTTTSTQTKQNKTKKKNQES